MKALKIEAVYLYAYETFKDVTAGLPRFIDGYITQSDYIPRLAISAPCSSRSNMPSRLVKTAA